MDKNDKVSLFTQANRKAWDASAHHHRSSDEWQAMIKGFSQPGFSTFDPTMTDLVRRVEVNGKRVVQVGCNNGREIASVVSMGASVAHGIDQSAQFLDHAAELKALVGEWSDCQTEFTCADIYQLPDSVPVDFDVCIISIGVLNWMPDLPAFFKVVGKLLSPGGLLLIYETHPTLEIFEPKSDHPYLPAHSYFSKTPTVCNEAITYDGTVSESPEASYWFSHTLSAILNSCLAANMAIVDFQEYPHSNREVEFDVYKDQVAQLPMCYSLIAKKS